MPGWIRDWRLPVWPPRVFSAMRLEITMAATITITMARVITGLRLTDTAITAPVIITETHAPDFSEWLAARSLLMFERSYARCFLKNSIVRVQASLTFSSS